MPNCPCCHGTQFEVNPLDEALCCVECGTVAEEAQLRTESGSHYEPTRRYTIHESEAAKTWLQRFAIYFDGTEETYNEALHWYKAHVHKCPRKYVKELALYIIYIIKKPLCAGLAIDNMMKQCPDTIDERRFRLVHSRLSSFVPHIPMDWKVNMDSHFSSLYGLVSKNMMSQRKKSKKKAVPDGLFDETEVRSMTAQLLSMFNDCDGGARKHKRPFIASAIAIIYLYCYYQRRSKPARPPPTVQQMLDTKKLASHLGCGYRTILNYLKEIQNFILVCIKNTPGIHNKDIKLKDAYTFLDLVIKYTKPKGSSRQAAFPLRKETVGSFVKAQEASHRLALALERAKTSHPDHLMADSLEFNMRILLENGVDEGDILSRSEVQIRQMCSVYYYRALVNSTTVDDVPDLDQQELTRHDMSEAELAGYLRE